MNPTWDQEWLTGTGNHMDDTLWPLVLAVAGNARLHASREVHDAAWDAFTFHENWTDSMSEEAIDRACRGDGALPIALVRSVIIAGTAVRLAIAAAEAAEEASGDRDVSCEDVMPEGDGGNALRWETAR